MTNVSTDTAMVNPDPLHDTKEFKFGFRTIEDKETGTKTKRPNVEIKHKVISFEGLVAILSTPGDSKEKQLLFSAVESVYVDAIKDYLADNESVTSENFPHDKFTWEVIANTPDELRVRGIPKETWEGFIKDYLEIMPGATGKQMDSIKAQASVLAAKLNPIKLRDKESKQRIIPGMLAMLTVYTNVTAKGEQFSEVVAYLVRKAEDILKSDVETDLESNLGL